ncbi:MAG: flagellar basal body-associated FliL family protein [Polymorphobacter sp.]
MAEAETLKAASGKRQGLGRLLMLIAMFAAGIAAGGGGAVIALSQLGTLSALVGSATAAKPAAEPSPAAPVKLDYVELDNAFTSNLVDTGRYLQVRIAVSTRGGPGVVAAITEHRLAIVSAILAVLGEAGEADVADRAAKDRLRASVRTAINDVLRRKAGTAGIDEVYFTSLVVQ